MKRSQINAIMRDTEAFLGAQNFHLPPFARWTPADWADKGDEVAEIVETGLGWDITDFGRGDFDACGLVLFTIRNGTPDNVRTGRGKLYCEKIAVIGRDQTCPAHHHFVKVEDIINRGGGRLAIQLHNAAVDGAFTDTDVTVGVDGTRRTVRAGETVVLDTGESITLMPGCYHKLWGQDGRVLFGEVSVVNDDEADNRFSEPVGRFPDIDEDESPYRLLIGDYERYWRGAAS